MAQHPEAALVYWQTQETALRAKVEAQRQKLLAVETRRKAAEKQALAKRWQALGKVVDACLGSDVTADALRAHLEQRLPAERPVP